MASTGYRGITRFKRRHLTLPGSIAERGRETEAGRKTQTEAERARQAKEKQSQLKGKVLETKKVGER